MSDWALWGVLVALLNSRYYRLQTGRSQMSSTIGLDVLRGLGGCGPTLSPILCDGTKSAPAAERDPGPPVMEHSCSGCE